MTEAHTPTAPTRPAADARPQRTVRAMPHRWLIQVTVTVESPLAIGDGSDDAGRMAANGDADAPRVNSVARDNAGRPFIPASGLKGALRAHAASLWGDGGEREDSAVARLFGQSGDQRRAGHLDLADLTLVGADPGKAGEFLAHYRHEDHTYIETSTRIDRDLGTVADRALFNDEFVAKGARFQGEFMLQADSEPSGEAAVRDLLLLMASASDSGGLPLGSDTRRGFGRVTLPASEVVVRYFGPQQLKQWIADIARGQVTSWRKAAAPIPLQPADRPSGDRRNVSTRRIAFHLQMTGKYLVNEPARAGTQAQGRHAHSPRLDADGAPVLPGRTVHGALRSQAEKILRTLGIACGGAAGRAFDEHTNRGDELIAELFGSSQRASGLRQAHPPRCIEPGSAHVQDFIAIDRFTGGGRDGAKYDAESRYQPAFAITLDLPEKLSDEARGLLLLTLRDLAEGDIPMGWGKRKGYGACTAHPADQPKQALASYAAGQLCEADPDGATALAALRKLADVGGETGLSWLKDLPEAPPTAAPAKAAPATNDREQRFHNTYHFIPVPKPNFDTWLSRKDFQSATEWRPGTRLGAHSHAQYAPDTLSGRIEFTITARSPLIVGGQREGATKNSVKPYRLPDGTYALPATSLKGMIGSLVEAASGSALRVLDTDAILSYRTPATPGRILKDLGIYFEEKDSVGESRPYIRPLVKVDQTGIGGDYDHLAGQSKDPRFTWWVLQLPNNRSGDRDLVSNRAKEIAIVGQGISRSGPPTAALKGKDLAVERDAIETFNHLADECTRASLDRDNRQRDKIDVNSDKFRDLSAKTTPYHLCEQKWYEKAGKWLLTNSWEKRNNNAAAETLFEQLQLRLKPGDVVYYAKSGDTVTRVAHSQIWRGLVKVDGRAARYTDFLADHELGPFGINRHRLSPAEFTLGFVEIKANLNPARDKAEELQALAFAGKLRFYDALAVADTVKVAANPVKLKVLSSPKPPSPALYFKPKAHDGYIAKSKLSHREHILRGRKHYLHALGLDRGAIQALDTYGRPAKQAADARPPWQAKEQSMTAAHSDQHTLAVLIESGAQFKGVLDIDNLSADEARCLAFALHPSAMHLHKLGMGKGIGLGSIRLDQITLHRIDRKRRYGQDRLDAARDAAADHDAIRRLSAQALASGPSEVNMPRRTIVALGDPSRVKYPVHVPQVRDQSIDSETFLWFVDNDTAAADAASQHQALPTIDPNCVELPSLLRRPKRKTR